MITGGVRFNRVASWNLDALPWARIKDPDALDEEIARMERLVNDGCRRTMDSLVGRITGW